MTLPRSLVQKWLTQPPKAVWESIFKYAQEVCEEKFTGEGPTEIAKRDHLLGEVDLFLSTASWDLWREYENSVSLTSKSLAHWWDQRQGYGRAVLILDGLSLRELPWLIKYADDYGFRAIHCKVTGTELPADTTSFAKAMGFGQRSSLANNTAPAGHPLRHAVTETNDLPWQDAREIVCSKPERGWCYWHHWPDVILHRNDEQGKGMPEFLNEVREHLWAPAFWDFVASLAQNRHLVITSDHGYAASGQFTDAGEEQKNYLKDRYGAKRFAPQVEAATGFAPPLDMVLDTKHGRHGFVMGRRKWKIQGGYPTLAHGGLSLLEVAVPWLVLEKRKGGEDSRSNHKYY